MNLESSTVLIINSNIGSRSILREVLKSFLYKVKITQAPSLREGKELIQQGATFDVAFVAFELGQPEISEFIASFKADGLNPPPFVATLKSRGDDSTSKVTSLYLEGVAGFISEPYSSNDISKLWEAIRANKNKPEPANKITKAANLILNEAIGYVDKVSALQDKKNAGESQAVKSLKRLSGSLEKLHAQDPDQYAKAIVQAFENVKPPKETAGKKVKVALKVHLHPGKIIADLMAKRNLTAEGLKESLKIEPAQFALLLQGEGSIDESMSREISRIFGRTSKEWMVLQANYDAYAAQLKEQKGES